MTAGQIPTLNAVLNGSATLLISTGWVCIKTGRKAAHRACMLAAAIASAFFLGGYVTHKILIHGVHTPFAGPVAFRAIYLAMLTSHIVLAMAIAGLVPRTFWLAMKGDFDRHRIWARWTFPIWLYVSVTGVLVYFSLYVWWPGSTG